ncbi:sensor histidine kinase [Terribacillus saccharophilus]|uniref:Signal transduction histidine-protein kinase/phosphatase DegS n=1 Tax=Terribacillus saccharophilus TaxID=361277 RepID=A0A075LNT0_9BACI|nr:MULTISPECIES: sensor histidine kinase [Terribacillus]AIF68044.1 histidine kinase [Terribacillus goriensis]MCM3226520.1 histidine kinase [Terribacillus saccharophilus]MEC0282178.1 histidine kinase [Terribacillus saccharophilus]MEC0289063.1 histidine kinase [Terribacillus saccharophilus]MEC0302007.1 histidine kinase [Terribacillus saccharophilus]
MGKKIEDKALDRIINEMVEAVENSKDEIFYIGEESRMEYEQLLADLQLTKEKVGDMIKEGDQLEQKVRYSKMRLSDVSRDFDRYSEEEIREVYEQTHKLQIELRMSREKEKLLRERRDEIQRRLQGLELKMKRAEGLVGKISVVLNYLNDDFKQVSQLIIDAKEKQEFGLKIIEAQEEERRRLSREMHDGPAQMLANILLRSELVDRTFRERSTEEALLEIQNMRKMVRSSLYEVRRIIYDLRPMALDDLGLLPTIRKYLANIEEFNNIHIDFTALKAEKRLDPKYEVALFRLTQEAVQNAVKHAEPSTIKVRLEVMQELVVISIIDDGKGFDVTVKKENSFGIIGMRERVEMLDGTIAFHSEIGKGTRVLIKVPLTEG